MVQKILIVGGGQGIGFEITKSILALSEDARIVVFGLHIDAELESLAKSNSHRLWTIAGDVTSATDRKKTIDTCTSVLGGIDTLIYSAGIITPIQRIEDVDIESVKKAYDVNVFGVIAMVTYLTSSRDLY